MTHQFGLLHTLKHLYRGQTLMRILMNQELSRERVHGKVADIGGGHEPDYFDYFAGADDAEVQKIDGSFTGIDFEKDLLPFADASIDTALLCNVLEHMYNYRFLLEQTHRILVPGGRLIGIVPFWVGYHPDPHDYFRYTHEALLKILTDAGFNTVSVRPFGRGPILANFNTIVLSLPCALRPVVYLWYAFFDKLFLRLRPRSGVRNPLGFVFTANR